MTISTTAGLLVTTASVAGTRRIVLRDRWLAFTLLFWASFRASFTGRPWHDVAFSFWPGLQIFLWFFQDVRCCGGGKTLWKYFTWCNSAKNLEAVLHALLQCLFWRKLSMCACVWWCKAVHVRFLRRACAQDEVCSLSTDRFCAKRIGYSWEQGPRKNVGLFGRTFCLCAISFPC